MLLLLIIGTVLLQKASTLQCFECLPDLSGSCVDTAKECPSNGSQCGAMRVSTYAGGSKVSDISMKSCAMAEQCVEGSLNLGFSRTVITSKCCTAELCNSQPAPAPIQSSPNGKKCFRCDGPTCNGTLNCEGDEDHCITATVGLGGQNITMKGCASQLICSGFQTAQIPGGIGVGLSCCQGNYCNRQPAPEPKKSNPNGKKCFHCDGQTCSGTVNCEGNEDHCMTTTVDLGGEKLTMKGCASKQMCSGSQTAQIPGVIGVGLSCCQGNYCNSAISTQAGLLLLVAPLVTWVMFS